MSIATKQTVLRDIERQLGSVLTVDNTNIAMGILANEFARFDVEILNDIYEEDSDDLLTAFIEAKQIEGRSIKTTNRYNYIIKRMLKEIKVPIRKITIYHLRSYLMNMYKRGVKDSTIEGQRSIFSSFFGWLKKEGLIENNPCANINTIKCAKVMRKPFSEIDIEHLKENCKCTRDKAIISFLLSTGCRIGEVCNLNKEDIDFDNLECKVKGKGNKERIVYINSITAMLLKRYFNERKDNSEALFTGQRLNRMTPSGIRVMLRTTAKKANVSNVHPHRFRRTLATNLINHGMSIQEVANILGHDKIDTTMQYVYIENENVKNSYRKYA